MYEIIMALEMVFIYLIKKNTSVLNHTLDVKQGPANSAVTRPQLEQTHCTCGIAVCFSDSKAVEKARSWTFALVQH